MHRTNLSPRSGIGSRHHPDASFEVVYTSIANISKKSWGFLCTSSNISISSSKTTNMGHSGIPNSRSTHTFHIHKSVREHPLLAPQLPQAGKSSLEEGRRQVTLIYESEAGSRFLHDRVQCYTYSFHPAEVVHLDPLESKLVGVSQLTPRHRSTVMILAAMTTIMPYRVWGASSREWSPRDCEAFLHRDPAKSCYSGM